MALLKDLWNFDQTLPQPLFYSKFSSLNSFYNMSQATPENLKNLQIKNLRQAYANKESFTQLNKFIQDLMGDKQGTEEDLFAKLVQGVNEGLDEFRKAENKQNPDWNKKNYYTKLDNIVEQINNVVNQATGEQGIPMPSIQAIKTAIGQHNYLDFKNEKAQYLEDLGKWIMLRAGLAGFQTGQWQAIDKFFGESSQTFLIEDAMGLLLENAETFEQPQDNFIQVQIQGYKQANQEGKAQANKQLQDWVNSIQELNGLQVAEGKVTIGSHISSAEEFAQLMRLIDNNPSADAGITISLSDNLYQQIQKVSVNIQAKSNIERHLANKGNRSLYSINPGDKYYSQLLNFSYTDPVTKYTAVTAKEQNTPYAEFSAYVNYCLSKDINNTVYGRNEYYLTLEGFTDLATLMEKRGFYIRIANSMLSYMQFLANSYHTIYD